MKKNRIAIYLLLTSAFVCCAYLIWNRNNKVPVYSDNRQASSLSAVRRDDDNSIQKKLVPVDGTVGSGMDSDSLSKIVQKSVRDAKINRVEGEVNMGVTSHHLPTASPLVGEFFRTLKENTGNRKVFVVMGPDHYEKCQGEITTTARSYSTPFGELKNNAEIYQKLVSAGVTVDDNCFSDEHAITVESNYIKYLYPDAEIVPILFSMRAKSSDEVLVNQVLENYKNDVFILVSIDFNHYHSLTEANASDEKAGEAIKSMVPEKITREMVDSPSSMKAALKLAKQWGRKPSILRKANSYEFVGLPENTTSYMNIVFVGK